MVDDARAAMHDYYALIGMADRKAGGMLIRPTEIRDAIAGFGDLGADEVMLYCHGLDSARWTASPTSCDALGAPQGAVAGEMACGTPTPHGSTRGHVNQFDVLFLRVLMQPPQWLC